MWKKHPTVFQVAQLLVILLQQKLHQGKKEKRIGKHIYKGKQSCLQKQNR